jgi:hypothetical protein
MASPARCKVKIGGASRKRPRVSAPGPPWWTARTLGRPGVQMNGRPWVFGPGTEPGLQAVRTSWFPAGSGVIPGAILGRRPTKAPPTAAATPRRAGLRAATWASLARFCNLRANRPGPPQPIPPIFAPWLPQSWIIQQRFASFRLGEQKIWDGPPPPVSRYVAYI